MPNQQSDQEVMIVYGRDTCPQSRMLRTLLNSEAVEYEWRDIELGKENFKDELRELAGGYLSVPTVIFPDGTILIEPWPKTVLRKLQDHPGFLDRILKIFKK